MCDPSSEATFLPRGAISASLGFPLHSAEISMSSRFVGRPQAFPDRASRGALFLTSLLILALLSLLAYVVKNFLVIQKLDPAPCSANCTIYASPSGNDKNSGSDPYSPKTFLGAAAATRPGSLVCLLPGTYDLDSSFTPPQSGAASAWIVYKSCGDGAVNFVWAGSPDASPMFKLGSGPFPSGPSYVEFRLPQRHLEQRRYRRSRPKPQTHRRQRHHSRPQQSHLRLQFSGHASRSGDQQRGLWERRPLPGSLHRHELLVCQQHLLQKCSGSSREKRRFHHRQ